jgi:hypothetical protein
MPIIERIRDAPAHWPDADRLVKLAADGALVLLPDRVDEINGQLRASFRDEAQALRVAARAEGLDVHLASPTGATASLLREHDATLVLGAVLTVPATIAATLVANEIQRHLDRWRASREEPQDPASFTVRYQEAVIKDGLPHLREVEGPAEAVIEVLRAQADIDAHPSDPQDGSSGNA